MWFKLYNSCCVTLKFTWAGGFWQGDSFCSFFFSFLFFSFFSFCFLFFCFFHGGVEGSSLILLCASSPYRCARISGWKDTMSFEFWVILLSTSWGWKTPWLISSQLTPSILCYLVSHNKPWQQEPLEEKQLFYSTLNLASPNTQNWRPTSLISLPP